MGFTQDPSTDAPGYIIAGSLDFWWIKPQYDTEGRAVFDPNHCLKHTAGPYKNAVGIWDANMQKGSSFFKIKKTKHKLTQETPVCLL